MAKLMFYFAGTGAIGENNETPEKMEDVLLDFEEDVIRVYFEGCDHEKMGGSQAFPDLEGIVDRISNAFDSKNETFNLAQLKQEFGEGICRIEPSSIVSETTY